MRNLFKKYCLSDLKDIEASISQNRDNCKIALIDDKTIALIEKLKKHNYQITHFKDVMNIDELSKFDIIISDIDGVGKNFGSKFQGGHLISEIYSRYPLKYLISYSSHAHKMSFNKFFSLCDNQMNKQADIAEWTACLDHGINNTNSPLFVWEKVRKRLISMNFSSTDLVKLEKAYIKSIITKNSSPFDSLVSSKSINYGDAVSTISAVAAYLQLIL